MPCWVFVSEFEYRSGDVIRVPCWLLAVVRIYCVVTAGRIIRNCLNHMDLISCLHHSAFNKYLWRGQRRTGAAGAVHAVEWIWLVASRRLMDAVPMFLLRCLISVQLCVCVCYSTLTTPSFFTRVPRVVVSKRNPVLPQ